VKTTALVLAAHGSRHEPTVNAQVRAWAAQAAVRNAFDEVAVAFHQGSPTFAEVLDSLTSDEVTVVPVMTSAGYYSDIILPRELARNRRFADMRVHITNPIGTHPHVLAMIAARARELMRGCPFPPEEASIALVGHGTPRHPASRDSTFALAKKLRAHGMFGEVIGLFLDDEPAVEELLRLATRPNILIMPFLIAAGPHATSDIPRRIGLSLRGESGPPFMGTIAGRRVLCDVPFGSYAKIIDLIMDLASAVDDSRLIRPKQKEVA
jgi:sirohydrochlorin cobaltochelatase